MSETDAQINPWQLAELFAAAHMRTMGFFDATTTPAGVDGGVDVVASDAVAQVKHQAVNVGAPVVQQLAGVARSRFAEGIFYCLSGYTRAAVIAAEEAGIALFSYTEVGVTAAWTTRAREFAEYGYVQLPVQGDTLAFEEFWAATERYGQRVADMVPVIASHAATAAGEARASGQRPDNLDEIIPVILEIQRAAA